MANSVDPDQTAPKEQVDQGLYCLLNPLCPNTSHVIDISVSLFNQVNIPFGFK